MHKKNPFQPAWWVKNKHIQSCLPAMTKVLASTPLRWEELTLPDGDFIDIVWAGPSKAPIIVLLHGLEGSVKSHYIQHMIDLLVGCGYQVVTMHFRSCSGRLNRQRYSYYAGQTCDLHFLVRTIKKRYPTQLFAAIGFSLGGNVLIHYLARYPHSALCKAVTVSAPFELHKSADQSATFYQWNLLRSLKRKVVEKIAQGMDMPADTQKIQAVKTIRDFDQLITAPLNGFGSAEEYYLKQSTRYVLPVVEHPTLMLHAMDDPLIPPETIPNLTEISAKIIFETSECGGHLGFIQGGTPWRPEFWMHKRIVEFLSEDD